MLLTYEKFCRCSSCSTGAGAAMTAMAKNAEIKSVNCILRVYYKSKLSYSNVRNRAGVDGGGIECRRLLSVS